MLQKLKKIFGKEALQSSVSCGNSEKEGCSCHGLKENKGLQALAEEQDDLEQEKKAPLYSKKEGCSCHGLKHNEKLKNLAEEGGSESTKQEDKKPPLYSEKEGCSCHGLTKKIESDQSAIAMKDDDDKAQQQTKKPPLASKKEGCSCHGLKKE